MAANLSLFVFILILSSVCWSYESSLLLIVYSLNDVTQYNDSINQWRQELNLFKNSSLVISYNDYSAKDSFAIVPLLAKVYHQYDDVNWFILVGPDVNINFNKLNSFLSGYKDPMLNPYYIGYGIKDQVVTITHHFVSPDTLLYPIIDCNGLIFSNEVMKRVSKNVKSFNPTFSIDPLYELSLFLKYMKTPSLSDLFPIPPSPHSKGVLLTHSRRFCTGYHDNNCITKCTKGTSHCSPVDKDEVFFAIKTCQKFHKERIPIQLNTWATPSNGLKLQYYSDVSDSKYNTKSIGVPNTERGHCTKLLEIFRVSLNDKDFKWLIIADDDTLISVSRLLTFLGCHDDSAPLVIGELYGYQLGGGGGGGYLYPTAGSGVLLTRPAVQAIINSGFMCPSHDYPDDMFLGQLIQSLKIPLLHSPLLHQNQPDSYHKELLLLDKPLTFHRFKPQDPQVIYKDYLQNDKKEKMNRREL